MINRRNCFQLLALAFLISLATAAVAQGNAAKEGFGVCKPVSQRTGELGCWILIDNPVGPLDNAQVFWYLDRYPTRAAAEAAKEKGGTVIESFGKVWLLTIAQKGWHPAQPGEHVSEIGPLPVEPGKEYKALYMEAVMTPGMTSAIHTHTGPEAWYSISGETCLETPEGKLVGSPGGAPMIVPAGSPMHLTAIGTAKRQTITLILHPASERPTTVIDSWKPKGLCK